MLSAKILLLPIIVITLSGVLTVVVNSPISQTVPVTPAVVTKSPSLKGRNITKKAPPAKFASKPPQAAPIATPAAAKSAANDVVSIPKKPEKGNY